MEYLDGYGFTGDMYVADVTALNFENNKVVVQQCLNTFLGLCWLSNSYGVPEEILETDIFPFGKKSKLT